MDPAPLDREKINVVALDTQETQNVKSVLANNHRLLSIPDHSLMIITLPRASVITSAMIESTLRDTPLVSNRNYELSHIYSNSNEIPRVVGEIQGTSSLAATETKELTTKLSQCFTKQMLEKGNASDAIPALKLQRYVHFTNDKKYCIIFTFAGLDSKHFVNGDLEIISEEGEKWLNNSQFSSSEQEAAELEDGVGKEWSFDGITLCYNGKSFHRLSITDTVEMQEIKNCLVFQRELNKYLLRSIPQRLSFSSIIVLGELPTGIRASTNSWVECMKGTYQFPTPVNLAIFVQGHCGIWCNNGRIEVGVFLNGVLQSNNDSQMGIAVLPRNSVVPLIAMTTATVRENMTITIDVRVRNMHNNGEVILHEPSCRILVLPMNFFH